MLAEAASLLGGDMKSIALILAIGSLIALATAVRAADNLPTTKPSVEEENAQLKKEIAKLREQLYAKDLELNRLQLKQRLATLPPGLGVPLVPSPFSFPPPIIIQPRGTIDD